MKVIVDHLKLTLDDLLDVKIGTIQNTDFLDKHHDFDGVTELYQLNYQAYELINDIFFKLFPDEIQWGSQSVFRAWENLFNANLHPIFYEALYKYYQSKKVDHDLFELKTIAEEVKKQYDSLMSAA